MTSMFHLLFFKLVFVLGFSPSTCPIGESLVSVIIIDYILEPSHQAPAQNQGKTLMYSVLICYKYLFGTVAIDAQFNEELRKIISEEINKVFFGPDFQQRLKDHLLSAVDATWTAKLGKW